MKNRKKVFVYGARIGIASSSKGASLGPDAIRLSGLHESLARLGYSFRDEGNTPMLEEPFPVRDFPHGEIRYLKEISAFMRDLRNTLDKAHDQDYLPLLLGGDHSVAIASIASTLRKERQKGREPGLIWFDAHGDLNTEESSPSGNIHGMPLAAALGRGNSELLDLFEGEFLNPQKCAVIGVRSVDPKEAEIINDLKVKVYTMKHIDEMGAMQCFKEALSIVSPDGGPIHLSFDIDGVDERFVPGTGTPVYGGLTLRETHLLLETLAAESEIVGMDMVEVNPLLDERNKTARVALTLIESALGKRIY